jgi:hypothetical protein
MRSPFLTALFHPLNILMALVAVIAGLVAAWWLFPLGILLWLIMFIVVWRNPALRMGYRIHSRAPLTQRFQPLFDRIERSQVSIFNSLSSAPARPRQALQPVQAEIDHLVNRTYALCQRMTVLENYRLVSQSNTGLESDLRQTEAKIKSAADPLVKREYEESRQSLQERLAKVKSVSTYLDRIEAQLVSLTNEMDGVVTEVVRMQGSGRRTPPGKRPTW